MPANSSEVKKHLDVLARLVFRGYSGTFDQPDNNLQPVYGEAEYVSRLTDKERAEFLELANTHHVTVRALRVLEAAGRQLGNAKMQTWCAENLHREEARIQHAIEVLEPVCRALETAGCTTTVIKSLDHWPDLGSDLDLYTTGAEAAVTKVMKETFHAEAVERSWGDQLANKWNFSVPGLPELIEIHVRYLGQTGEHTRMARRVVQRRIVKELNGHKFFVPAPEERIVISTLQRMYRHFYFRLCDMCDVAALLQSKDLDFAELRRAANAGGIWRGVATFLFLVMKYAQAFGVDVQLPPKVIISAYSPHLRVHVGGKFLRVPKLPAASLYASQLANAGLRGDLRAISRLPLLPPLAISALVAYRVTGSDKGVW